MASFIAIFPSIITGAVAIAVCIINNNSQQKQFQERLSEERRIQSESHLQSVESIKHEIEKLYLRLEALSEKVDKHNHVIERTYELEKKTSVYEEQLKVANHRIDDLENKTEVM